MKPGFAPLLWRQMFPLVPFLFRSLSGGPGKQAGCRATRDGQLGVDTIAVAMTFEVACLFRQALSQ